MGNKVKVVWFTKSFPHIYHYSQRADLWDVLSSGVAC